MNKEKYYIDCICECNEHVIKVSYYDDEFYDEDGVQMMCEDMMSENWKANDWLVRT